MTILTWIIIYSVFSIPVIGGLIALIIFIRDKKTHNNRPINYPPNYFDSFVLKKDVLSKEDIEKIVEEKVKELTKDGIGQ